MVKYEKLIIHWLIALAKWYIRSQGDMAYYAEKSFIIFETQRPHVVTLYTPHAICISHQAFLTILSIINVTLSSDHLKQPPVFFCHTRIWQNHIIFLVVQKTQNH